MKKIFISCFFISLFFLFQLKPVVLAGPQCNALGGTCKLNCDTNTEEPKATQDSQDCPLSGLGGNTRETCCVPLAVPRDGRQCRASGWTCENYCTGAPKGEQDCPRVSGGLGGPIQQVCCDLSAPSPTPPTGAQCKAQGWTCETYCSGAPKGNQDCPKVNTGYGLAQQTCCDLAAPSPTPPTGAQCSALGGTCVLNCLGDPKGTQDCPPTNTGYGGEQPQTCCVATTPANPLDFEIPGVGCGVPNDTTGANKCCQTTKPNCNFGVMEVLQVIPGIGDWIRGAKAQCESLGEFQEKYGKLKCLYGQEKYDAAGNCCCVTEATSSAIPEIREMCKKYLGTSNPKEFEACDKCAATGFYTGIGCIPLTLGGFTSFVFSFGIGLGGIIALLCIIYSAFVMQTSGGNPERIKKAQENLTSCIMGLMLIIFAIFILRVIGVNILKIHGFG